MRARWSLRILFLQLSTCVAVSLNGTPLHSQPNPEYILSISSASDTPNTPVDIEFLCENNGLPISGWAWGVAHDPSVLELTDVVPGETTLTINGGELPQFYSLDLFPGLGWTVGAVIDLLGVETLPPGAGYQMNVATYLLTGPEGTVTEISYTGDIGEPPVIVTLVDMLGEPNEPIQKPGTISIESELFRRGDADASGVVVGLVDGLFLLSYQFIPDSPPPPCLKAADGDDDGVVHGLIDGLYILNFQFIPGSPPPPPPGPTECGPDVTSDTLGCESYTACP